MIGAEQTASLDSWLTIASPSITQERTDSVATAATIKGKRLVKSWPLRANACRIAQRQDAEAIMLDFVEPVGTARRSFGRRWQAGLDKAGRAEGAL